MVSEKFDLSVKSPEDSSMATSGLNGSAFMLTGFKAKL